MLPFHRSEYFKTAMNTAVGHSDKTMEVNEFSHKVLTVAVDFMYGKEIPEDFNLQEDLKSLLEFADYYLMDDLKDAAGFLIGKTISQKNIFDISKFADNFRATLLIEQCAKFFCDNHASLEYIHLNGGFLQGIFVKWLTVKNGDQAHGLLNQSSSGPFECLDLLTEPFYF